MPSTLNELFGNSIAILIYLIGIVLLVLLLISANANYHKNRSFSVGAIFIISMIFLKHTIGSLSSDIVMDLLGFLNSSFFNFGLIMTGGIIFFIIMSCVRMIIERIQ